GGWVWGGGGGGSVWTGVEGGWGSTGGVATGAGWGAGGGAKTTSIPPLTIGSGTGDARLIRRITSATPIAWPIIEKARGSLISLTWRRSPRRPPRLSRNRPRRRSR